MPFGFPFSGTKIFWSIPSYTKSILYVITVAVERTCSGSLGLLATLVASKWKKPSSVVEHLPCMQKDPGSDPGTSKQGWEIPQVELSEILESRSQSM